jgi:hypothetical protein
MKKLLFGICIALAAVGCDSHEGEGDEELCEHLNERPGVQVQAGDDPMGAPAVRADHLRYEIALNEVAGGYEGLVSFASDRAGERVVALDADVPFAVFQGVNPLALTSSATSSEACVEIKGRSTFELGVGTYAFKLGPTALTSVGLVIE